MPGAFPVPGGGLPPVLLLFFLFRLLFGRLRLAFLQRLGRRFGRLVGFALVVYGDLRFKTFGGLRLLFGLHLFPLFGWQAGVADAPRVLIRPYPGVVLLPLLVGGFGLYRSLFPLFRLLIDHAPQRQACYSPGL